MKRSFAVRLLLASFSAMLLASCGKLTTTPESTATSQASTGTAASYVMVPLSWEKIASGSSAWSAYVEKLILTSAPALLSGSSDVTNFCSNYTNLSTPQRANFWAYLISEVAYYESGDSPTSRYVETTMGIDPITGSQVVSEGLLQLSYQDQQGYPFCQFNWAADSRLAPTSATKTILDPYINLNCGTLILNSQIQRRGLIQLSSGAYWSTLMTGSKNNRLSQIKAATQSLPFCANPS